jgi:hypothetical protein
MGKTAKVLARELVDVLVKHKKTGLRMTEALVSRLETARGFTDTRAVVPVLSLTSWGSTELADRCEKALTENSQVSRAYGMAGAISSMITEWRGKPHN